MQEVHRSSSSNATTNRDELTRYPPAPLADQQENRVRHVVHRSNSFLCSCQRHQPVYLGFDLWNVRGKAVRLNGSRRNGINGDPFLQTQLIVIKQGKTR